MVFCCIRSDIQRRSLGWSRHSLDFVTVVLHLEVFYGINVCQTAVTSTVTFSRVSVGQYELGLATAHLERSVAGAG